MKISKYLSLIFIALALGTSAFAQVLTNEDSLQAGLVRSDRQTVLSGYGEVGYQRNLSTSTANINATRGVIFMGHKFTKNISFFSEIEIEDAKIAGGESGGEISFEQLLLRFNLSKNAYIVGGLFIPRIGIINENHLPTTYYSVSRPMVEREVIPATWRELGVGIYGTVAAIPGLNYFASLTNGLNFAGIGNGRGIRDARFEGRDASANNLAITAALLYYVDNFRLQASTYYGGTVGATPMQADKLQLQSGAFGTPVALYEANAQYHNKGFYAKALVCYINIPDAEKINTALGAAINNAPEALGGYYVEGGYNILHAFGEKEKQLIGFMRYENYDLNSKVPSNGIKSDILQKQFLFAGLAYLPIRGVIIKADFQFLKTGDITENDQPNPSIRNLYLAKQSFVNVGIAYSF